MRNPVRTLGAFTLAALVFAVAAWRSPDVVLRTATCGPTNDAQMLRVLAYVRNLASNPKQESMRIALKVPTTDPALIQPIQSDSLCDLAATVINRQGRVSDTTSRTIYLVRIGSVYFAEDPKNKASECVSFPSSDTSSVRLSRPKEGE